MNQPYKIQYNNEENYYYIIFKDDYGYSHRIEKFKTEENAEFYIIRNLIKDDWK